MPFEEAFASFIGALEAIAVGVFAVTGALVASRKEMDIFGFALLGTVTGLGGGTVRDLLLGHAPVFWVTNPTYAAIALTVSAIVYFTAHIPESRYRLLLWLDAVGLSLVCVIGADRGLAAGAVPFIAIIMGVITAVFGGIIRDVLGGESPIILRREIYVIPALLGAIAFVAFKGLGTTYPVAATLGFALCFTV
ncbi:MAG TPA: trimeric intracellular cation channel family protein, partial [Hyphomicrobiaceae bacterium]|nr:trimeric intracellular cation channel family protein [Hyphomicrobiaceae bacterium]